MESGMGGTYQECGKLLVRKFWNLEGNKGSQREIWLVLLIKTVKIVGNLTCCEERKIYTTVALENGKVLNLFHMLMKWICLPGILLCVSVAEVECGVFCGHQ